jgi:poly-beta-1,6-N-acetyl-D-glucosamine synthase
MLGLFAGRLRPGEAVVGARTLRSARDRRPPPTFPAPLKASNVTKGLAALGVAAGAGHVLYPAALAVLGAVRPQTQDRPGPPPEWPGITVIIPAFREVGTIGGKLDDLRANGYRGPLELLVVSEDPETAEAARSSGARVLEPTARLGKAQAVNEGVRHATHPVVVVTDANNTLSKGALALLARHLDDPFVGAAGGAKTEEGAGEALYWRFETWLKERESQLGSSIGIVGELFAVRKEAWRPIPVDIGMDDLWTALDLAERGYAVRFEPRAKSIEPAIPDTEQWERRTRNIAGALHVFRRKRHLIRPRGGLLTFEIVGHKLWRSTVGPVAHVLLLALSLLAVRRNALARLVIVGHLLAGALFVAERRGRHLPGLLAAIPQVVYLQLVALGGLVRFARREISPTWQKQAR